MPSKRWIVAAPLTDSARTALADYPPLIAQLLFNRGYAAAAQAQTFLNGELDFGDDPLQILGLAETVERLRHAMTAQERIAVYGDYDTDGVTASALLVQVLTALGADVQAYIPNREDEGYGLNDNALNELKDRNVGLVITVDCGIRSLDEAETARALGLDLIITDHHTPGDELPRAFALINPKQPNDAYPEKNLCGVGLAFKLAQGLIRGLPPTADAVKARERATGGVSNAPLMASDVLDLVAIGTVADLVPLSGENRRLVRQGLKVINSARPVRTGLQSLIDVARLRRGALDAGNIGFALGPRLNAAGRLESAMAAYELLTTADVFRANQLAQQLEAQNRERQTLTRETHVRAREIALAAQADAPLLFAADPEFRHGVVGLAAARLMDEFYRPAVVARRDPDYTRGSARSIREFHITQAFDECRALLEKHGGHAAAAGFTARTANADELAERLRTIAARDLDGKDLRPALRIDAEVPLSDLTGDLARALQQFEPCGYGNPTPILASRDLRVVEVRPVGADGHHLKMTLGDGRVMMDAIAFNQGEWRDKLPARIDLAYTFEINEWNGNKRLQLNVKDIVGRV